MRVGQYESISAIDKKPPQPFCVSFTVMPSLQTVVQPLMAVLQVKIAHSASRTQRNHTTATYTICKKKSVHFV